jgi:hypothetical protein
MNPDFPWNSPQSPSNHLSDDSSYPPGNQSPHYPLSHPGVNQRPQPDSPKQFSNLNSPKMNSKYLSSNIPSETGYNDDNQIPQPLRFPCNSPYNPSLHAPPNYLFPNFHMPVMPQVNNTNMPQTHLPAPLSLYPNTDILTMQSLALHQLQQTSQISQTSPQISRTNEKIDNSAEYYLPPKKKPHRNNPPQAIEHKTLIHQTVSSGNIGHVTHTDNEVGNRHGNTEKCLARKIFKYLGQAKTQQQFNFDSDLNPIVVSLIAKVSQRKISKATNPGECGAHAKSWLDVLLRRPNFVNQPELSKIETIKKLFHAVNFDFKSAITKLRSALNQFKQAKLQRESVHSMTFDNSVLPFERVLNLPSTIRIHNWSVWVIFSPGG